ncbi:hypothetical protein GJU39_06085 [Pedobacter petrophilus]|uniref:Uncharacterized protein n=1 Tax=Pedobacter petrophilus TaxID=1908241 RepID=A0A7K0FX71_9SPHI|nr:hypothetical protein [Pedobacter petrophilus]MRX75654.1 hypothetical protein [Pedobacter petrophilus]
MNNEDKAARASQADHNKFEQGLLETRWTETGEPFYVVKDGNDLKEFALLAKLILEDEKAIAHDFTSKVVSESGDQEVSFEYKSGWFLEGLGEGEIE